MPMAVAADVPGEEGGTSNPERSPAMRPQRTALVPDLVSIVLPVHNGADLLDGSIRSVLAQTYRPIELIVVDDGSTDDVEAVLSRYAGHPDVRIVVQPNQQLPRALTHGFLFATGEFWTWTSDDNLMDRRQVERMVAKLRAEPDTAMTYADYYVMDERGNPLANRAWRAQDPADPVSGAVRLPREVDRLNVLPDNFIGPCFMYRGWIGRILRSYDVPQGVEDYDYWMRMNALFRIRHVGISEPLYWYRVHARTLSDEHAPKIRRRVDDLMDKESDRAAYFAKVVVFQANAGAAQWLADRKIADAVRTPDTPIEARDGPALLVVAARSDLEAAIPPTAGVTVPLALVFDDASTTPYDAASVLSRPHTMAVVASDADAARVRVVSAAPVVDAESSDLAQAMQAFARDAGYWIVRHAQAAGDPVLPSPFVDASRRMRIVIDIASDVGDDVATEVVELASSLGRQQLDAIVVLREDRPVVQAEAAARSIPVETHTGVRSADTYRSWLQERNVALVNAHGAPFAADVVAGLAIPFVQTLRAIDADVGQAYRDAAAATTAYLAVTLHAARAADLTAGLDPSKMHLWNENGHADGDLAAAHARLFHALLRR